MGDTAGPFTVVCLKAFGDFVIARSALRRSLGVDGAAPAGLAIGSHLVELNEALGPGPTPQIIVHPESGVPAVFDVRRSGLARALRSGLALRSAIATLAFAPGTTLLFDRTKLRERFLASGRSAAALVPAPNIYRAYEATLGSIGAAATRTTDDSAADIDAAAAHVAIFPGSRIARKRLPGEVISALLNVCKAARLEGRVFVLDGEPVDFPLTRPEVVRMPRKFTAMAAAARGACAVVSSDSLPAHLAEFFGRPVFVASPAPNPYWLPGSSFRLNRWCLFSDLLRSTAALHEFVSASTGR